MVDYNFTEMLLFTNSMLFALVAIAVAGVAVFVFDLLNGASARKKGSKVATDLAKHNVEQRAK